MQGSGGICMGAFPTEYNRKGQRVHVWGVVGISGSLKHGHAPIAIATNIL